MDNLLLKRLFWLAVLVLLAGLAFVAVLWPVVGLLGILLVILLLALLALLAPTFWRKIRPFAKPDKKKKGDPGFVPKMMLESCSADAQRYVIDRPDIIIGRQDDCDIVIPHPRITRHHCQIKCNPETGLYYISDLGSSHGTYVNAARLPELVPHMLEDGHIISLDTQKFVFRRIPR